MKVFILHLFAAKILQNAPAKLAGADEILAQGYFG